MTRRANGAANSLPAARAGSREALGAVLAACQPFLLLIADQEMDHELKAKADAADLVQETFLDAYRDFRCFLGSSDAELRAWLRRLLLNNLGDFRRRYRGTAKRQAACETTLEDTGSGDDPMDHLLAHESTPGEWAIAHEQAEILQRALERLPTDCRQVVRLRSEDHLPFKVISRLMGRSANAVEKLWLRGVERLREELKAADPS